MSAQLASAPVSRFTKQHPATHTSVIDAAAGLEWAVNVPSLQGKFMTYEEAKKAIAELDHGGRKDWRLPTPHELFSLVGYTHGNKVYDADAFPDMRTDDWYWTDQVNPAATSCVFAVTFGSGAVFYLNRHLKAFCRPVASVPARQ
ncbi:DUF1566 domain-containing protein [Dyella mobilis]|uniref:DUF1566 domain-containing protein n=1 Tax=Dyella mobilis TaxID=1849582 RepID=A0ABS2KMF6_9GAMM|nr:DUF1566 domain-containing protein [Dyella mobilis]MBM7131588.1 DUF1566 domain-containing protein [Dyella mobilis]GLQ96438.1 hypothetical protein GCM10007863_08560 [Dyella mobilis]